MSGPNSASDREWALDVLRQSLRTSRLASPLITTTAPRPPLDDPEKLEYLRDLIQYVLDGRTIVASYNLVLLAILFLLAILHFHERTTQRRRWRAIEGDLAGESEAGVASSSSSILEGSLSSQASYLKPDDDDIELRPLLGPRRRRRLRPRAFAVIRSWLMYQPAPMPLINRPLPSNGTSLSVAAYFGLNAFAHLFRLPFERRHFFVFADRAGCVFVVNLPLLYLLAAKNQPLLRRLTGRSYEALNIYHRRVGELMCLEALVHTVGMLLWRLCLAPAWLAAGSLRDYFAHPLILLGIAAASSYALLYLTSLAAVRARWYELFLASHVALQLAALAFLWLHFATSRPYVLASLAIFAIDRVVWRVGLRSATLAADVRVLEDGGTVLLSADWDMPRASGGRAWLRRRTILYGWRPADHVFISVPELGGSNALQAHPFTISSAAPSRGDALARRASLRLLIRAHSGFTSQLLRHARTNPAVSVRVDGPYGSRDPLDALRARRSAVLVAGGSGVAVVLPLLWDLAIARPGDGDRRTIHFLWIIRSASQRSWVPEDQLDELRGAGVRVTIPRPTVEAGRPDVAGYIADVVVGGGGGGGSLAADGGVGVVVSGPDGLNRTVSNACALKVRSGIGIDLRVEKFGW
ncbi:putative ferric reductase transmembrane component [Rosellinia necatrix]|uniref:Putative ferric reductase transmembrane component n=1 Tax=Rosellinia necatrix TaxID=77044 RepID=A0A1W2THT2_ROSNE|nr:putative ferric reductase transmembrane component [Rosellinia necatrix]